MGHRTLRYVIARIRLAIRHRLLPDEPWLAAGAVREIAQFLKPHHEAVEFGAGRSTLWLARRCGRLVSVEHNPTWSEHVAAQLTAARMSNVDLRLRTTGATYETAIDDVAAIDFALIDGRRRHCCAMRAAERLRPGGMLVLDNAERYPATLNEDWRRFYSTIATWPKIQHDNGVSRTDIWLRPAA